MEIFTKEDFYSQFREEEFKKYDKLLDFITKGLLKQTKKEFEVVIAGGAIRDLYFCSIPKDVDVFVLTDKDQGSWGLNTGDIYDLILNNNVFPGEISIEPNGESEKHYESDFEVIGNLSWFELFSSTPIQIIYSNRTSVMDLISSFDWNICQAAYTSKKTLFANSDLATYIATNTNDWTEHGWNKNDIPFILKFNTSCKADPKSILRRGLNFEKKYDSHITQNSLDELCWRILDGSKEKLHKKFDCESFLQEIEGK